MIVGYFHRELGTPCPTKDLMIASVRKAMPDVVIVQLPDSGGPLALAVLDAYASVAGEWLFLDTDVIVQQDVRRVFDQPFDVAVADRLGTLTLKEVGTKFMARMPYNKGAVFSRCQEFWHEAVKFARTYKVTRQEWMGDQQAMCDVIAGEQFAVRVLSSAYNYPPLRADEDVRDKCILHFKGPRKAWMLHRSEAA